MYLVAEAEMWLIRLIPKVAFTAIGYALSKPQMDFPLAGAAGRRSRAAQLVG